MSSETEENEADRKRKAHEFLMESSGWLGVVYREQVKRVRQLREQLERMNDRNDND